MKIISIEGNLLSTAEGINAIVDALQTDVLHTVTSEIRIFIAGVEETINSLLDTADQSKHPAFDFSIPLHIIEATYLTLARNTIPVSSQSAVLSAIRKRFNEVDDCCKGIQLLGTYPSKTMQAIRMHAAGVLTPIIIAACSARSLAAATTQESRPLPSLQVVEEDQATSINLIEGIDSDTKSVELWVSSIPFFTADPGLVKNAQPILSLSFEEAIQLSKKELGMLDPNMIGKAFSKKISINIRTMGSPQKENTKISDGAKMEHNMITGISSVNKLALVQIEGTGMIGVPGFAQRVFASLYQTGINIILISQDASEHSICFAVQEAEAVRAVQKMEHAFEQEIEAGKIQPIRSTHDVCIVGLIGENMRNHPGVSGRMFSALGRNGINILAIAQGSNERNISAAVASSDRVKAINVLHEAFFEDAKKEINLYILGTGNVGKKLIEQLTDQMKKIAQTAQIKINLAGICNSKKMVIDNQINMECWSIVLHDGEETNLDVFSEAIVRLNKRNSVFVDVTDSALPPNYYERLLRKSVSVVACNKIAASNPFPFYHNLKQLAVSYNCKFLFETNVGAALPIIGTLNDLIKSGDSIIRIEAVLSGTLNYVFNHYDGQRPFAEVVRDAQQQGYTEPDPRLDLSGKDVMRKIMILAREAGEKMEMEDIVCNSFLPESCMDGSVEDFYVEMEKHEDHFKQLLHAARNAASILKFVATLENGKASVGLQHIKPESEMYHLYGKDNIVLFYTERYAEQPLVVKGAGAGAAVTASGVFADIIRTINH